MYRLLRRQVSFRKTLGFFRSWPNARGSIKVRWLPLPGHCTRGKMISSSLLAGFARRKGDSWHFRRTTDRTVRIGHEPRTGRTATRKRAARKSGSENRIMLWTVRLPANKRQPWTRNEKEAAPRNKLRPVRCPIPGWFEDFLSKDSRFRDPRVRRHQGGQGVH